MCSTHSTTTTSRKRLLVLLQSLIILGILHEIVVTVRIRRRRQIRIVHAKESDPTVMNAACRGTTGDICDAPGTNVCPTRRANVDGANVTRQNTSRASLSSGEASGTGVVANALSLHGRDHKEGEDGVTVSGEGTPQSCVAVTIQLASGETKIRSASGDVYCPRCRWKIKGYVQLMKHSSVGCGDLAAPVCLITKKDTYGVNLKGSCPACTATVIIMWRLLPVKNVLSPSHHAGSASVESSQKGRVSGIVHCPECGDALRAILEFGFPEFESRNSLQYIMPKKRRKGEGGAYDIEPNPYDVPHADKWGENNLVPCPHCKMKIIFGWRAMPVRMTDDKSKLVVREEWRSPLSRSTSDPTPPRAVVERTTSREGSFYLPEDDEDEDDSCRNNLTVNEAAEIMVEKMTTSDSFGCWWRGSEATNDIIPGSFRKNQQGKAEIHLCRNLGIVNDINYGNVVVSNYQKLLEWLIRHHHRPEPGVYYHPGRSCEICGDATERKCRKCDLRCCKDCFVHHARQVLISERVNPGKYEQDDCSRNRFNEICADLPRSIPPS